MLLSAADCLFGCVCCSYSSTELKAKPVAKPLVMSCLFGLNTYL